MISRFLLRLPVELKERLAAEAASNGRSLNAELVWRLHQGAISPAVPDITAPDIAVTPLKPVVSKPTAAPKEAALDADHRQLHKDLVKRQPGVICPKCGRKVWA